MERYEDIVSRLEKTVNNISTDTTKTKTNITKSSIKPLSAKTKKDIGIFLLCFIVSFVFLRITKPSFILKNKGIKGNRGRKSKSGKGKSKRGKVSTIRLITSSLICGTILFSIYKYRNTR